MVVRRMKEKCKDAARMRREKERAEFNELARLLPLPSSTTNQLDKASIIRLTSSYLRIRAAFPRGLGEDWGEHGKGTGSKQPGSTNNPLSIGQVYQTNQSSLPYCQPASLSASAAGCHQSPPPVIRELGQLILQTLDGFVFALHRDGKIMYISETASVHLGLPQIDLSGSSIFEYTHQADHNDLIELLSLNELDREYLDSKLAEHRRQVKVETTNQEQEQQKQDESELHFEIGRSFCMRMKCILPKRNAGLVSNGFKAIHCSGYLKVRRFPKRQLSSVNQRASSTMEQARSTRGHETLLARPGAEPGLVSPDYDWDCYALVAVGHSLLPTASTEVKLNSNCFMFRSNLDFRLNYVESAIVKLLGYQHADLIGQSLYNLVHVADIKQLDEAHRLLLRKGQAVSKYFRLMRQSGGHVWLQIHATTVNNPRSMPKPQHVVSICNIIDGSEAAQQVSCPVADDLSVCLIERIDNNGACFALGPRDQILQQKLNRNTTTSSEQQDNCAQMIKSKVRGRNCSREQQHGSSSSNNNNNNNIIKTVSANSFKRKPSVNPKRNNDKINSGHHNHNLSAIKTLLVPSSHYPSTTVVGQHQKPVPIGQYESGQCQYYTSDIAMSSVNDCQMPMIAPKHAGPSSLGLDQHSIPSNPMLLTQIYRPANFVAYPNHQTIGSSRRASDDSCSVVSSVMSTFSSCSSNTVSTNNRSMNNAEMLTSQQQQSTNHSYQPLEVITTFEAGQSGSKAKSIDYDSDGQGSLKQNNTLNSQDVNTTSSSSSSYSLYNSPELNPIKYDPIYFGGSMNTLEQYHANIHQQHTYIQTTVEEIPIAIQSEDACFSNANEYHSSSINHQHCQQYNYHYQPIIEQSHMTQYQQTVCSMDAM